MTAEGAGESSRMVTVTGRPVFIVIRLVILDSIVDDPFFLEYVFTGVFVAGLFGAVDFFDSGTSDTRDSVFDNGSAGLETCGCSLVGMIRLVEAPSLPSAASSTKAALPSSIFNRL